MRSKTGPALLAPFLICNKSHDPEDRTALTPKNLMLGCENASLSFMPSSARMDARNLFKDMIWKKCTQDYLPQLNQRSKWSEERVQNFEEGDRV